MTDATAHANAHGNAADRVAHRRNITREQVEEAIRRHGNTADAAAALGVPTWSFRTLCDKFDLRLPDGRRWRRNVTRCVVKSCGRKIPAERKRLRPQSITCSPECSQTHANRRLSPPPAAPPLDAKPCCICDRPIPAARLRLGPDRIVTCRPECTELHQKELRRKYARDRYRNKKAADPAPAPASTA